jgi:hypothetical protein
MERKGNGDGGEQIFGRRRLSGRKGMSSGEWKKRTIEYRRFNTWVVLLAIAQQGINRFRKAICHSKALNVLKKKANLIFENLNNF